VVRTVSKVQRLAHTAPLFKQINIMPLNYLIKYTQNLLTHSSIHKYSPTACHNQWILNSDRNPEIDLRNANDIYIPRACSEQVKILPYFAFANNWNTLPYDRLHQNPTTFRIFLSDYVWNLIMNES
jgi:hypothetical protein